MKLRKIRGGLILIVDPATPDVLVKVDDALKGGVDILLVLNKNDGVFNQVSFVNALCCLGDIYNVPVIIHNDVQLLLNTEADGIHFDELPDDLNLIRKQMQRPIVVGVKCSNDRQMIARAIDLPVNYLFFYPIDPTLQSEENEVVLPQVVRQTRQYTSLPIFLAGGVTPKNTNSLMTLGGDGVAVFSDVMKTKDCSAAVREFKEHLNIFKMA